MIPPEPDPPGPDPPTPGEPNEWYYNTYTTVHGGSYPVWTDVSSANGAFVGVACVGFDGSLNRYSDGSLIQNGGKKYPYNAAGDWYYDYDRHSIFVWDSEDSFYSETYFSAYPFDSVPADFCTYLSNNDYSLSQSP